MPGLRCPFAEHAPGVESVPGQPTPGGGGLRQYLLVADQISSVISQPSTAPEAVVCSRCTSRPRRVPLESSEQGGLNRRCVRVQWPLYAASADGKDGGAGLGDSTTALDVRGGEVLSGPVGRPGGSSGRQEKSPSRTASAAAPARMRPRRRIRPRVSRWRHGGSAGASSQYQASPTGTFLCGRPVRSRADGSRGADRAMASSLSVRNRLHTESGVGFGTVAHLVAVGAS